MTVGNISVSRDFSDVRDVVRAYRLIMESGRAGEVYNVGSGRALPLCDLLETIKSFCRQPIEVEIDTALIRPNDTASICCDYSKINEELGWKPKGRSRIRCEKCTTVSLLPNEIIGNRKMTKRKKSFSLRIVFLACQRWA